MASVELLQACALSLDINPDSLRTEWHYGMSEPAVLRENFLDDDQANEFQMRLRVLNSQKSMLRESCIQKGVSLTRVVELGASFGWKMPLEMVAIRASGAPPPPESTIQAQGLTTLPLSALMETALNKTPPRSPKFGMRRDALVQTHRVTWPTIERDMKDASANGLARAKAGLRDWNETAALEWARANGKLKSAAGPADTLTQGIRNMASLPARAHKLKG